ncbi:MAG: chitobiase/beta-hexosaminidase C-terminal domain-containing protein [Euryarchaeota archaeon]|nr:chitobiase/beta-hexosaminidase C-terminal domain-containing protein [Euryarchaeota archaeon]
MIFLERKIVILGAFFLLSLLLCGTASAATVMVNPGTDAIKNAVSTAQDGDTLSLAAGTYYDHDVVINKNLVITGPEYTTGDPRAIIDAEKKGRVFNITPGVLVTLRNLMITNGSTIEYGGGVHNSGQATIQKCKFTKNQALWGGAVYNNFYSSISTTDCVFHLNTATAFGGAVKNEGSMTMTTCTLNSNTAPEGGALNNGLTMDVRDCIFMANTASIGGVLNNYGQVNFVGCTFTRNSATINGGVVDNYGATIFSDCTMTSNTADHHGAVFHNNVNFIEFTGCTITGNNAPWGGVLSCFNGRITGHYNRITGNTGNCALAVNGGEVQVEKNWWGSNAPSFSSMIIAIPGAKAYYNPWIVLSISRSADTVAPGGVATVTIDLNHDNTGALIDWYLPDLPVVFTGTVNPLGGNAHKGLLATTFTAGSNGLVTATVDDQMVSTTFIISETPLMVESVDPANNAVDVATNQTITISYNQNIQAGTMDIKLQDNNGNNQNIQAGTNGKQLKITPTTNLKEATKYTLTINQGAVRTTNNKEGPATTTTFTTITPPLVVYSTPGTGSYWAPVSVVLAASEPATTTIYYTLDGTSPTTRSPRYSAPIYLAASRTLKFLGIDRAGNPSLISTQHYSIYALQSYRYWTNVRVYGRYKYSYKVAIKRWYRKNGKWRYHYKYITRTKWKKGWHYVGAWKTGTRWVLT